MRSTVQFSLRIYQIAKSGGKRKNCSFHRFGIDTIENTYSGKYLINSNKTFPTSNTLVIDIVWHHVGSGTNLLFSISHCMQFIQMVQGAFGVKCEKKSKIMQSFRFIMLSIHIFFVRLSCSSHTFSPDTFFFFRRTIFIGRTIWNITFFSLCILFQAVFIKHKTTTERKTTPNKHNQRE